MNHNPLSDDSKPAVYGAAAGIVAGLLVYYLYPKSATVIQSTNPPSGEFAGPPAGTLAGCSSCGGWNKIPYVRTRFDQDPQIVNYNGAGYVQNNGVINPYLPVYGQPAVQGNQPVWNPILNRWETRTLVVDVTPVIL